MIQLGIIACGDVAFRTYIPGIQNVRDRATVAATFDPLAERAERAAAMFEGAVAYTSLEAFLAHPGLQGVFNLTPANFHTSVNQAVLDAGLHLLSEKPIASTVEEGQALARQAAKDGLIFLCAPATMATGRFQWLKSLIDNGAFGQLTVATGQMVNMGPAGWKDYTGDPRVFYSAAVGPVLDTGVYVLHGITGLLGPARRVQAFAGIALPERISTIPRIEGERISVESPDVNMIHLDFGDNRFAQILSSFAVPASNGPSTEIHGSLGSASILDNSWYDANGPADLFFRSDNEYGQAGWNRQQRSPAPPVVEGEHLIGAGARHFVDCIEGTSPPIMTADHAIHILEIIHQAQESARTGRAIDLTTNF
ncbi:MAG: Gfo/Idh/MocA family oxidoreductase [Thermomicrobiales bacterium]|nr:Gfo/Idh/MocA family oxidoreductase [Thermomicrobiales bacterium]